ncbi:MAG: hypothetical protein MHPSP_002482, partial [Paramarteilia canceri]
AIVNLSECNKYEIYEQILQNYAPSSDESLCIVSLSRPVFSSIILIEMLPNFPTLQNEIFKFLHYLESDSSVQANSLSDFAQNSLFEVFSKNFNYILKSKAESKINSSRNFLDSGLTKNPARAKSQSSVLFTAVFTCYAYNMKFIWDKNIFQISKMQTNVGLKELLCYNFQTKNLVESQERLVSLQLFLRDNARHIFNNKELANIISLMLLNEATIEFFALLIILSRFPAHQLFHHKLWSKLTAHYTAEQCILDQNKRMAILVENLLYFHLKNDSEITKIANELHGKCPQLFAQNDLLFAHAVELLSQVQKQLSADKPDQEKCQQYLESSCKIMLSLKEKLNIRVACRNLFKCQAFFEIAKLVVAFLDSVEDNKSLNEVYGIFIECVEFLCQIIQQQSIDESIGKYFQGYSSEMAEYDVVFSFSLKI